MYQLWVSYMLFDQYRYKYTNYWGAYEHTVSIISTMIIKISGLIQTLMNVSFQMYGMHIM